MDLQQVARELYGVLPEQFVKERTARVKQARADGQRDLAKEIERLRKPTTAGWLLNSLVREHPSEIEQVLVVGADMRAAQENLDADQLRALNQQRRQLIQAIGRQAKSLAQQRGQRVSPQVATEVEDSLLSAMSDSAAAHALSTGLVTDSFMTTGLEPVDLRGLVAVGAADPLLEVTGAKPATAPPKPVRQDEDLLAARRQLRKAKADVAAAEDRARRAREAFTAAEARLDELAKDRRRLEEELRRLDAETAAAEAARDAAQQEQGHADRDEAAAHRSLEEAEAEVEQLP